jgi:hypothetical protein
MVDQPTNPTFQSVQKYSGYLFQSRVIQIWHEERNENTKIINLQNKQQLEKEK